MGPIEMTVVKIRGDYAELLDENGVDNTVALALLPDGIDEGSRLRWENFSYELL